MALTTSGLFAGPTFAPPGGPFGTGVFALPGANMHTMWTPAPFMPQMPGRPWMGVPGMPGLPGMPPIGPTPSTGNPIGRPPGVPLIGGPRDPNAPPPGNPIDRPRRPPPETPTIPLPPGITGNPPGTIPTTPPPPGNPIDRPPGVPPIGPPPWVPPGIIPGGPTTPPVTPPTTPPPTTPPVTIPVPPVQPPFVPPPPPPNPFPGPNGPVTSPTNALNGPNNGTWVDDVRAPAQEMGVPLGYTGPAGGMWFINGHMKGLDSGGGEYLNLVNHYGIPLSTPYSGRLTQSQSSGGPRSVVAAPIQSR